jgi:four helix bundle protein
MYKFSFEKLDVWQLAKELVKDLYQITNSFPGSEKYGLISQINRSAISVTANIAEGSSRIGKKDQSRFYIMAYSSLLELTSHLIIATELGIIKEENLKELRIQIAEISNKLNALNKSTKTKNN